MAAIPPRRSRAGARWRPSSARCTRSPAPPMRRNETVVDRGGQGSFRWSADAGGKGRGDIPAIEPVFGCAPLRTGVRTGPTHGYSSPRLWKPKDSRAGDGQARLKRTRHLHQVHHARPARRRGGTRCCKSARRSSFTKGRIIVRGKLVTRGKAKRADYILYYKPNIPLALIEAKDNTHSVGDGMQQALDYADDARHPLRVLLERRRLRVPRPHRRQRRAKEANLALDAFPSPADLWARYRAWKGLDAGGRADRPSGLLRRRQRQGAALLSGQRRQRRDRGHRQGPQPHPARHGDRHRQDLHRLPDHLAAVEGGPQEAHPLSSPTATC